jgi:hypothetical protein
MRLRVTLCALLLSVSGAFALPPKIDVPVEVKPVDGWVRVVPVTDAVSVVYVPLDGLSPFPSEELRDPRRLIVPVHNAKEGRYRFVAVASSKTGEQVRVDFVVLVGTNPKPVDPVVPPLPEPDTKFGLKKISKSAIPAGVRADAKADLAKAQRSLSSAIAAGGLKEPAEILSEWRKANNAAVVAADWSKWGSAVGGALQKLFADGKLKDKSDWAAAFTEIADGLEG